VDASTLRDALIDAHGGRERWRRVAAIEAALSSGGLAFASKGQGRALEGLRIRVEPHARRVTLHDFGGEGGRGVWTPARVALHDAGGTLLEERADPRAAMGRPMKRLAWDRLDILYFAGYALWNYLSFPFLLDEPGVALDAATCVADDGTPRLDARFDDRLPTHSREQSFHLDASLALRRHDYTADVIGGWARAANLALASERVDGLRFYTRRRVLPRLPGLAAPLPGPVLVRIEIDDLRVDWRPADGGVAHPA